MSSTYFRKEEITQFGQTVDASIQKASGEIQSHIDKIGAEVTKQRTLTKADVEALINFAATRFGEEIDTRVRAAKIELASLVTEKVAEVRTELTAAANEQKRTAVRNATVAIAAALVIGAISVAYRRYLHGDIDLMFLFRAVLGAFAFGHMVWLIQHYAGKYSALNRTQRSLLQAGAQYIGALRPKGALGHLLLLALVLSSWLVANFWQQLYALVSQ